MEMSKAPRSRFTKVSHPFRPTFIIWKLQCGISSAVCCRRCCIRVRSDAGSIRLNPIKPKPRRRQYHSPVSYRWRDRSSPACEMDQVSCRWRRPVGCTDDRRRRRGRRALFETRSLLHQSHNTVARHIVPGHYLLWVFPLLRSTLSFIIYEKYFLKSW